MRDLNSKILCFRHCNKTVDIFSFEFPNLCPICGVCLASADLHIPPFVLPSPFKTPRQHSYSFILKPTTGDFSQYKSGDDLHIGLTGKEGNTWDYNESGVRHNHPFWKDLSLVIPFAASSYLPWEDDWDHLLSESSHKREWQADKYHLMDHNCYDYALHVVQHFEPSLTKVGWTESVLINYTRGAARYLTVFHYLNQNNGILIQAQGK